MNRWFLGLVGLFASIAIAFGQMLPGFPAGTFDNTAATSGKISPFTVSTISAATESVASAATLALTTTANCGGASNPAIVVVAAYFAHASGTISGVSDGTNSYTGQNAGVVPSSGQGMQTYYHAYSGGLASGATITITYNSSNTSGKYGGAYCISAATGSFVADVNPTVNTGTQSGSTCPSGTGNPTSTSSGTLAQASEVVFGFMGINTTGGVTMTDEAGWNTLSNYAPANGILVSYYLPAATTAITYSPCENAAHGWGVTIASFHN